MIRLVNFADTGIARCYAREFRCSAIDKSQVKLDIQSGAETVSLQPLQQRLQFPYSRRVSALAFVAGGLGALILSNVVYQAYVVSQTTAIVVP